MTDQQQELNFWKEKSIKNEAIIGYLVALAFQQPDYQVATFDGPSHPEDPRVVLVRDSNNWNLWHEARFGFDSDVAKLADQIHRWVQADPAASGEVASRG